MVHAHGDGPVRFEIGMRWSALWRLAHRPWVARAFLGMLRTEGADGLCRTWFGVRRGGPVVVQEWEGRDALDRWARADAAHARPWSRFRREAGGTAAWGIWHRVS